MVLMFKQKDPIDMGLSLGSSDFVGCAEIIGGNYLDISGEHVYQIKVTRNGIDSIYYDTFINNPYVTDTFKIFY